MQQKIAYKGLFGVTASRDLGQGPQPGTSKEQVTISCGPRHVPARPIHTVLGTGADHFAVNRPIQQIDVEVMGQPLEPASKDRMKRLSDVRIQHPHAGQNWHPWCRQRFKQALSTNSSAPARTW